MPFNIFYQCQVAYLTKLKTIQVLPHFQNCSLLNGGCLMQSQKAQQTGISKKSTRSAASKLRKPQYGKLFKNLHFFSFFALLFFGTQLYIHPANRTIHCFKKYT